MTKIKKIREIKSKIKKIEKAPKGISRLETGIQESENDNFTEFVTSRSKNIVPVLDAEQIQTQEEAVKLSPVTQRPKDHESSVPQYAHSNEQSESLAKYISSTSSTSVNASLRQTNLTSQQSFGQDRLTNQRAPLEEDKPKYQKDIGKTGRSGKKGYSWER